MGGCLGGLSMGSITTCSPRTYCECVKVWTCRVMGCEVVDVWACEGVDAYRVRVWMYGHGKVWMCGHVRCGYVVM